MKIESRVTLSREELETINSAWEILSDYYAECVRVGDPDTTLRDNANQAAASVDNFICEYADKNE